MLDDESKNIFLQNLDEYILDEERIVTSRWLANTLNISYKDSTNVLSTWIENKKDSENLLVTFAVTGKRKDGSLIVTILRDYAVEDFVQDLIEVSKSVYSAQKGALKNIQLLAACNEGFSSCLDCIKGPLNERRVVPSLTLEVKPSVQPDIKIKSEKQNGISVTSNINKKESETLPTSQKPSKAKEINKGGIANFFNKPGAKKTGSVPNKNDSSTNKSGETKTMQNFFKKTSPQNSKNIIKKESEETQISIDTPKITVSKVPENTTIEKSPLKTSNVEKPEVKTEEISIKKENNMSDDDIIMGTPEVIQKKNSKKNNNKKKSKRVRENSDEDNMKKKRKRLVVQSDSSDDEIFGNESEDEQEFEENRIKNEHKLKLNDEPEVQEKASNPNPFNKKVKKFVNRTYEDDEGFIITTKEVEEFSASEDEEPPEKKAAPSPPKPQPKKTAINPGTKQSNLMSFFKKK
uniref:DNA polymerase delta subunit 3 n=1 Tax=Xenopsylla cheopis TaxID=163159 RepID=A0A6M2DI03_XENCH